LGYLGEINARELERMSEYGYCLGDYVGKAGVELVAEQWLRGEDGGMQVQVYADAYPQLELDPVGNPRVRIDSAGRRLLTLGRQPPRAGNTIRLTLDSEVQRIVEAEMGEYAGAVIVMDANSGAIRAMASRPSFDPNVFVSFGTNERRLAILSDPMHPLLSRAFQAYAPGSTVKMIMAYAALSEGIITPETRFTCTGSFKLGRRFRCWKDSGHGSLDVVQALAYSCDVFFYNIGLELGIERIEKYARMFGLGQPTGMDIPGEMCGLVPSPKWKAETFSNPSQKKWYEGETLNVSIGQGQMLVTPLQMARVIAAIVNGGRLVRPYMIESVETPQGGRLLLAVRPVQEKTLDGDAAIEVVKDGLRNTVNSRHPFFGTAWRAKNEVVSLLGKTGTAQVSRFTERADTAEKLKEIPYEQRDHAWFAAATETAERPLVIVVFCEHGGHASESAVPIAREIAKRIAETRWLTAGSANQEGPSI
jgi:penicillin-binding protein 2